MESNFKPRCEFISSSSLENESGASKSLNDAAAGGVAGRSVGLVVVGWLATMAFVFGIARIWY